jgi:hypothetical protein
LQLGTEKGNQKFTATLKKKNSSVKDKDDQTMTLQLNFQSLIYNAKQCQVLTVCDITEIDKFAKLSADNKMLSLLTSSVTHEMITPLKCIIEFA